MQVVTVSRQLGSLGDVIAAIVAKEKGYRLIGPEQVHERAQTCDTEFKDICHVYETERGPGFWERLFFDTPVYTALFKSLTYEFASEGKVVLIGRGAQLILHDVPGVFNVRTVAPLRVRAQRVAERLGMNETQAEEMIRKHDRKRQALMQSIFDHDVRDWALYDMILNTTHYSAAAGAQIVGTALDCKIGQTDLAHWRERLSSMALAKRVEAVIKKRLTPATSWKIEVEPDADGTLVLTGTVTESTHKHRAEKVAEEYPGVKGIRSEIKVTQYPFGY